MSKFDQAEPPACLSRSSSGAARLLRSLVGIALLIPLAACATKRDVRDLQTEIREISSRQEALLRELQRDQSAIGDSVQRLSRAFEQHRGQISGRFQTLEDLIFRVQELAGLSQQEMAALRDQMALQRQAPVRFDPGSPAAGGGVASDIYDAAMTQLRRGSLTSARMGFEDLIDRFPNHELTPHARYHLADIAVQEGDREAAIEAFESVARFHPDSERVPDALYRVGMLFLEAGESARAREYLDRVVNTWPESGAADLARSALRQIP